MSGALAGEVIMISSVASAESQIETKESDSNKPTMSYGYGGEEPIILSS